MFLKEMKLDQLQNSKSVIIFCLNFSISYTYTPVVTLVEFLSHIIECIRKRKALPTEQKPKEIIKWIMFMA